MKKTLMEAMLILFVIVMMTSFLIVEITVRSDFMYALTIGVGISLMVYVTLDDIIKRHF